METIRTRPKRSIQEDNRQLIREEVTHVDTRPDLQMHQSGVLALDGNSAAPILHDSCYRRPSFRREGRPLLKYVLMYLLFIALLVALGHACVSAIDKEARQAAHNIRQHHDMVREEYRLNQMDRAYTELVEQNYRDGRGK